MRNTTTPPDLVVFSHLRWDFVFQRPQHLLSRSARRRRVYFVEEPLFEANRVPVLEASKRDGGVTVVLPRLPAGLGRLEAACTLERLVDAFVRDHVSDRYIAWYYTPMALPFTRRLDPAAVVYDCMDELSNFKGAPPELCILENELLARADVVFTGGISLYEHKSAKHRNIHAFPSSVDVAHFGSARQTQQEPSDQRAIPGPRLGYAGVIDERFDSGLVGAVAAARPDWQFVLVGPVVKIDPASLPRAPNIHYLGSRAYAELPAYLAGWDVAMLPFARNDATRFISPTKTPEYLAAGLRVVSTSIRDVVRTYGECGLASIADDPSSFVAAVESSLTAGDDAARLARIDETLGGMSWDRTHEAMWRLIEQALAPARESMRVAPEQDRTKGAVRPSGAGRSTIVSA